MARALPDHVSVVLRIPLEELHTWIEVVNELGK